MRKAILLALLVAALAAGAAFWRASRQAAQAERLLLLEPEPGAGLDPALCMSLGSLISDELEIRTQRAITLLPTLSQPFLPQGRLLLVRPRAARDGDDLKLVLEWAEVGPGRDGAWHRADAAPSEPGRAIEAALQNLPVELASPDPALLPKGGAAFWSLLQADSAAYSNRGLDAALDQAQQLAAQQPGCAFLHATVAHLDTLRMLQSPDPAGGHVDFALAAADQALALSPGYPRALRYVCRLLSDQGHQTEALDRLQDGLQRHPDSLNLLFALDYAARTAGLMDIAVASRARIQSLWAGAPEPPPSGYTYLYAGRLDAFEASFRLSPGMAPSGFNAFNLGYADLMRGRTREAETHFLTAEQDAATEGHFRILAKVFRFGIEGRREDARAALDALDRSRVGLQVPDGEFTFTMAEAAGFIGDEGHGMDLAQRAFSQGFTCSAWYRASPFLAKVQPLPRWHAILQHVDERRERLAERRGPKDFGL